MTFLGLLFATYAIRFYNLLKNLTLMLQQSKIFLRREILMNSKGLVRKTRNNISLMTRTWADFVNGQTVRWMDGYRSNIFNHGYIILHCIGPATRTNLTTLMTSCLFLVQTGFDVSLMDIWDHSSDSALIEALSYQQCYLIEPFDKWWVKWR